jgi:YidC/Oxa1 family membrane protein insertase
MEERRLLIAVALSLLVLTAYQMLFPAKPVPPGTRPGVGASAVPAPVAPVTATPAAIPAPGASPAPAVAAATPAAVPVADEKERRVELEAPTFALVFTNKGARLLSWQLLEFKDARGRPEEMVRMGTGPRALDIETGDPALDARLATALFRASSEHVVATASADTTLRFEYAAGDVAATKTLTVKAGSGLVELSAAVHRAGVAVPVRIVWGPGIGTPTAAEKEVQGYEPPHGVYDGPSGVERIPAKEIGGGRSVTSAWWAGVESRHFAALFIPSGAPTGADFRVVPIPGEEGPGAPVAAIALPTEDATALLYVGPKDHTRLARIGHRLEKVVNVGTWIGPIVVPLIGLLKWAHHLVGNYGWAIVVLTILINLVMSPFRHYSIANGVKMAKLSPEMRVIQERYRKVPALDPRRQEMQKEIGELYARHGMSMGTQMAVGCLPILLTMPFLIAFYRVLTVAIELRGASWLWIPDLSQKDPLFITPVLMAISMFVMQRMTPTAMDPAQQRMMMIMPLVLGVMFFAAPGGLNLYWLASNLCAIVQQGVTLRMLKAQDERRSPAKTRRS